MASQEDLAQLATTLGLGIEGASIFAGVEPDATTDPCVTFKGYGSEPRVKTYDARKPAITAPRVQVTVRSRSYGAAQGLADALYDALFQSNVTVNGTYYTLLEPMSEPTPIGPDSTNRIQIGFNVRTRRRG